MISLHWWRRCFDGGVREAAKCLIMLSFDDFKLQKYNRFFSIEDVMMTVLQASMHIILNVTACLELFDFSHFMGGLDDQCDRHRILCCSSTGKDQYQCISGNTHQL